MSTRSASGLADKPPRTRITPRNRALLRRKQDLPEPARPFGMGDGFADLVEPVGRLDRSGEYARFEQAGDLPKESEHREGMLLVRPVGKPEALDLLRAGQ